VRAPFSEWATIRPVQEVGATNVGASFSVSNRLRRESPNRTAALNHLEHVHDADYNPPPQDVTIQDVSATAAPRRGIGAAPHVLRDSNILLFLLHATPCVQPFHGRRIGLGPGHYTPLDAGDGP
jgi:hypothetical protein